MITLHELINGCIGGKANYNRSVGQLFKVVRLAWADRLRNENFFFRCVRLHLGLDVVYLVFDYCVRSRLYFR